MHGAELANMRSRAAATADPDKQNDLWLKILSEERQHHELLLKWVTLGFSTVAILLTAAGILFQLDQSNRLRRQEIVARQKEYSTKFYEKQIQVYSELCGVIARIMLVDSPTMAQFQEFDELIAGKVLPFADKTVRHHTIALNHALKLKAGLIKETAEDEKVKAKIPGTIITNPNTLAMMVINDCRISLGRAFPNIDIGGQLDSFPFPPRPR